MAENEINKQTQIDAIRIMKTFGLIKNIKLKQKVSG